MSVNQDKIKATVSENVGKVKETAGDLFNDKGLEKDGIEQKTEGRVEKLESEAKSFIQKGLAATGDFIETIGDKVEHAGFKKVGDAIEKIGDKIEHLGS